MSKEVKIRYSKFFRPEKYKYPILFVVFIFLGQDLLLELPVIFQKLRAVNFKGVTEGKIESVTPKKVLRQTLTGNRLIIEGYHVTYTYEVDDKIYKGETYLPNGTTQYASTYQSLKTQKPLKVKYNLNQPEKSTLDMPYDDVFLSM